MFSGVVVGSKVGCAKADAQNIRLNSIISFRIISLISFTAK